MKDKSGILGQVFVGLVLAGTAPWWFQIFFKPPTQPETTKPPTQPEAKETTKPSTQPEAKETTKPSTQPEAKETTKPSTQPEAKETTKSFCPSDTKTFVSAETNKYFIYICGNNYPNKYIGISKNGGSSISLKLSEKETKSDYFVAVNGNISYVLTRQSLTVTEDTKTIVDEPIVSYR